MTYLEREGIVRQSGRSWWIFYARSGEVFSGPFASKYAATEAYYALKSVDRAIVSQTPPGANTDREFLYGTENGRQFQDKPHYGDFYAKECLKRGGQVKGRKYISQLARFKGDPEAWVGGRGDVQRVLEKRGWGSEGSVKVQARTPAEPPPPPKDIADKIVDRETAKELLGQTVTGKEYKAVRARVKERLTPSWKKK